MPDQPIDPEVFPRTLDEAARTGPPAPAVTLSHGGVSATGPLPPPPTATSPRPRLGRYELFEELGRGGMGAVLRGRDPDLDRDLAVKVLLPGRADILEVRRRFVEEARIGGRLQHPGVVPVHELGCDANGSPFFTMKLVQGRTLADLLRSRPDPTHDLSRFLPIFEQVCQTVAYAHSRNVIHRDLKPQNIMVGAFGEVQLMDWGLAKRLGEPEGTGSGETTTGLPSGADVNSPADRTQAGTILGTPAYMAPEQARGLHDQVNERADVFALGAILCQILTGDPPYTAGGSVSVLEKACAGDLDQALTRLNGCGADAELTTLAKACLDPQPAQRLANGAAVAAGVAAYRTGVQERLRRAEVDRAAAQARAEEARKRQRLTMAVALGGLLLLGLVGGGVWWVRQQRLSQEAELTRDVDSDLAVALAANDSGGRVGGAGAGPGATGRRRACGFTRTAA
jgi:eukaryotic-like serine/threonine-protein kinase